MNQSSALLTPLQDPLERIKKITVLYNIVKQLPYGETEDLLADEDTVKTAQTVAGSLKEAGFTVDLFDLNENTISALFDLHTDIIFNLCYGIGSIPQTEAEVVKILEKTAIPFTGASHKEIALTIDKLMTKKKFIENYIPTPAFQVFISKDDHLSNKMKFPLIVKPIREDCSLGIHNQSVVASVTDLKKMVNFIIQKYHEPALVEEYIAGRELNVTILGNNKRAIMLPISEIIFGNSYLENTKWKIVDFESKWIEESVNFIDTPGVCPAKLDKEIVQLIERLSLKAYFACGCKDYARIDLRLSKDNIPYFLEINLNPGIGIGDGAVRSAIAHGLSYTDFLKEILRSAISR